MYFFISSFIPLFIFHIFLYLLCIYSSMYVFPSLHIYLCICFFLYSLNLSSFIQKYVNLSIYVLIYSFIHSFIYSLFYLFFIHLFGYLVCIYTSISFIPSLLTYLVIYFFHSFTTYLLSYLFLSFLHYLLT